MIRQPAAVLVLDGINNLGFSGGPVLQKSQPPATPEKTIAIRAATLIDGTSDQLRHNVLFVVKGNKIASVSDGGQPPAGVDVINFPAGVTVLPGLIDTHTHIFLQGEDPAEGGYVIGATSSLAY